MRITEILVEYGRTVGDGNYGSERMAATLFATLEDGDDPDDVAALLTEKAQAHVLGTLKASQNETVRWALEAPEEAEARHTRGREEWERKRAEREAATAARAAEEPPL